MAHLITILPRWTLGSSRSRQTHRTLDTITTSRTLRPSLTLEAFGTGAFALIIFWYLKIDLLRTRRGRRKNYSQVHLSLLRDLGDPEDLVYQIDQLDLPLLQDLAHQENPICVRRGSDSEGEMKVRSPFFLILDKKRYIFNSSFSPSIIIAFRMLNNHHVH